MAFSNGMSAQPCGCDQMASSTCEFHVDNPWVFQSPPAEPKMQTFPTGATIGVGGAPTRATTLPTEGKERKKYPVASGVLDYFPDAIVALSKLSYVGNEQHNPGQPLHWARGKSTDEADTMIRHYLQRGTVDVDGIGHTVKMAWRAMAILQKELEQPT